jgi:hypothetical protein
MNIRLHHAVSDIDGVTGMRILGAIVDGERDPRVLARLRDKRCRKSEAEIAEELTGNWREEHLFNLKQAYRTLCFLDERVAEYDRQIREMYAKIAEGFPPVEPPPGGGKKPKDKEDAKAKADLARICGGFDMTGIDGIGYDSAASILAELGPDLSAFPTGSVLDIVLHPSAVKGEGGLEAFYGLLMTYFARGGFAMHGNVFDAKLLREAQMNPQKYKTLQVRVCGWNALWNNLDKKEQDAYILRAENIQ